MSKEDEEGTRGSDEGVGVEVALDDFVARIVRDPNDTPDLLLLSGYLGASSEEGHVRLYLDEELGRYVEIPGAAIRHTQEIPPEQSPLGGSLVWIERKAEVLHGKVGTERQRASFLEGQIAQDYIGGGGVAAEGFPAAVAGRVAIPDPSRVNPNCTFFGPRCRKTVFPDMGCTIAAPGCGKSVYPNVCTVNEPGCPPPVETDVGPRCQSRLPSDRNCPRPDTEFDRRCPTNDVLCTFVNPCVYTEAKCWQSGYAYCPKPNLKAQAGQQAFARGAEGFAAGGEQPAAIPQTQLLGCQSQSGPCITRTELPGCQTLTGIFCTRFGPGCRRTVYEPACTIFGPCQITTPGPHCPNTLYAACPTYDFNCQATGWPCAATLDPATGLVGGPHPAAQAGAQHAGGAVGGGPHPMANLDAPQPSIFCPTPMMFCPQPSTMCQSNYYPQPCGPG